ncbi:MAG: ABC transporter substrate-binding protein [Propionivibrio sp.]|uniref:ABC transporter substrate-binding protein n=1 Tax=Candidatus Propionivibrio dominans TaxID=2954373 RepID=A0A9D7F460_9RHOO|nr:ABC transporter substrate-binding protein [Candidatus Propionivibrio dominans]
MKLALRMRQHPWLALLLALLAVLAGLAFWRLVPEKEIAPGPPEKLVLGVAEVLLVIPVLVAEEQGFLRDAGLDVTTRHFPSGKAALDALFRGEVEVATVAETPIVLASFKRRDFVLVGSFLTTDAGAFSLAHPASGIQAVTDLRGRRVGVVAGTIAEYCLHVLLSDHGLSEADIDKVPLAGPQMAAALFDRHVDAIAAFEPFLSQAQKALGNAARVLLDRDRCSSTTGYFTSRDFPRQRQEALVRLLRGTGQGIDWMRSHRQEATALVARRLDIAPADLEAHWDDYRFALELSQSYLVALEDQAQWAMRSGLAPGAAMPNYLDFIDFTALEAVKPKAINVIH